MQMTLACGPQGGGTTGFDISYPQQSGPYPSGSASNGSPYVFGIVGVNGGKPFTANPYLAMQYAHVAANTTTPPALYMNIAYPVGPTAPYGMTGPAGDCAPNDEMCQSYNYGYNAADYAYNNYAISETQSVTATLWWLDVETTNSWSPNHSYNTRVIAGAISYLQSTGVQVGIYSTRYMWNEITGGHNFGLPIWVPGVASLNDTACRSALPFNGGTLWLVQFWNIAERLDEDFTCSAILR